MTLTLSLPADLESEVLRIPDLDQRLSSFVREQVALEKWRQKRYGDDARRMAQESLKDAATMSRDEAVAGLEKSLAAISTSL